MSEAMCIRSEILEYCIGNGVDIGFGGDKIKQSQCIAIDLGDFSECDLLDYAGDARNLPFRDEVLDYVFSSHLLEDFENTREVVIEWIRVIKSGGYLILNLPIQKLYVENCKLISDRFIPNISHKVDMSPKYLLNAIYGLPLELVKRIDLHNVYSFCMVFKKINGDCYE
jgi:SAM-dependent methyltransferase